MDEVVPYTPSLVPYFKGRTHSLCLVRTIITLLTSNRIMNVMKAEHKSFLSLIKDLRSFYKPSILIVIEPRISRNAAATVHKQLGFKHHYSVEPVRFSGGIWMPLNSNSFDVQIEMSNDHAIHSIKVVPVDGTSPLWLSTIYLGIILNYVEHDISDAMLQAKLLNQDPVVRLNHTYRETNFVVDSLANFSIGLPLSLHMYSSPPPSCFSLLWRDLIGSSQLRQVLV
ncbi:hypothetical protein VNO78_11996 [Psophocarpus tetragonolobus]|uniref:RNase H type-1 domain-containing protein n=1 Tax=Psophocarpus tetragonolobus TaxID=3891 RepID=A0AAN9SQ65_PSOTE